MPQVEAYVIREKADGSKSIVYEPGHYDYQDAVDIARRAAAREIGSTFHVVKTTTDIYGWPSSRSPI